uniref:Uncharacterized protein n=1 Tax=Salarias fasciatus TaxID=181472 RepID=A0A672FB24_SALFA
MPGSDASHLSQALMSLPGEFLCVPAAFPTFKAMSFADTNDINHLILVENRRHRYGLLQVLLRPVHLVGDTASIQLHLHDVTVFLHHTEILVQLFLSRLILPLLTVLGEGLLLALVPKKHIEVFVKSALALVAEVLGKDGFQGSKASHVLMNHIPVVHTECGAMNLPQDVGHPSFVAQEGSEVDRQAGVIFGPRTNPPPVLLAALVRQEPQAQQTGTT